ncbi:MAG: ATP-binding cassette domain-containing protein [Gammaproteobacteria bacterium]|nr:ATP-binding cassette domain-containing protein [Gammaproteobacteria bacterium]
MSTVLTVEHLAVQYAVPSGGLFRRRPLTLTAVDDVSFELRAGETLGIVGETGCGKSSLGKAVLQLVRPAAGRVLWQGRDLCTLGPAELKACRKDLQIIFQDPLSSLNPRMTIGEIVAEPLEVHYPELGRDERRRRVDAMLERVGLRPEMRSRYPNEFSGGQCQRISIARAMISGPKVIVCDEPVSSLDVSIQAQICNLLRELQRDSGVSLLFISHDLSIVRYMSHRVLVMYLGRVMEMAPRDEFFGSPRHPYSQALISAVPVPDPDHPHAARPVVLDGELPSPMDPPSGCVFRTRCPLAVPVCITQAPPTGEPAPGHHVRCHRWTETAPCPAT